MGQANTIMEDRGSVEVNNDDKVNMNGDPRLVNELGPKDLFGQWMMVRELKRNSNINEGRKSSTLFCTCSSPCPCDLTRNINNYKNTEFVICFLKGLNDSSDIIKTQILLLDPLPDQQSVCHDYPTRKENS